MLAVEAEVRLRIPARELLHARVAAVGEGFTDLAVLDEPQTPPHLLERGRTFLEFVGDDGVFRVLGALRVLPREPGDDDLDVAERLRFEHQGGVQLLKRREFVRTDHVCRVEVVRDDDGAAWSCVTGDVSGGGLLLRGLDGVEVGDELAFELRLGPGASPIVGRCRVVRQADDGAHGVAFTEIERLDQDRLVAFAFERELEERERRRAGG